MTKEILKDKVHQEMLDILSDGPILQTVLSKKIRRKFSLSKQAFYSRLKSWVDHNIILKTGHDVYLPRSRAVKDIPYSNAQGLTTTRQENYCLKYLLKDPLRPEDPPVVLRQARITCSTNEGIQNHEQADFIIEGFTARLDTKSLLLWAPHIYSTSQDPSILSEAQAKALLDAQAEKLERKLHKYVPFILQRINNGMLYSERIDIELEEEEHEMAKAKPKGFKFEVHHPQDKRLRAKIDISRGPMRPEVALMHRKTAPADRDTMNTQFNALFDGQVNLLDIPEIRIIMGNIAQLQKSQAEQALKTEEQLAILTKQINVHQPFWQSMNTVAEKLTSPDATERHKAEKAIKEEANKYKQKKLDEPGQSKQP